MFLLLRPVFDGAILWLVLSLFASRKWESYDFDEVIKVAAVVALAGFGMSFFMQDTLAYVGIVIQGAIAAFALMQLLHLEQKPAIKVSCIFMGVKLAMVIALALLFSDVGGGEDFAE